MCDKAALHPRAASWLSGSVARPHAPQRPWLFRLTLLLWFTLALMLPACSQTAQTARTEAPYLYYRHLYDEARQVLEPRVEDRDSPSVVLFNLEYALAALAQGDHDAAEDRLLIAYEFLTTGGVNDPARTLAAEMIHEGHRVWVGEPYEQAMAFYYLSVIAMLQQDWDNARSGARNALFSLHDLKGAVAGDDSSDGNGADDEDDDEPRRIDRIESQFVLGYLLVGLNDALAGQSAAADAAFNRALELRPALSPLVEVLRRAEYDTLLIVDHGRAPRKESFGPNNENIRFVPDGTAHPAPRIGVFIDGEPVGIATGAPTVDLWQLAQQPKWWSLATARRTRSVVGRGLTGAGLGALVIGGAAGSEEAVYAGIGATLAGLALQSSATADTRHLKELPRTVHLVPLNLGKQPVDVRLHFEHAGGDGVWHDLTGGRPGRPRVYYLRMHDVRGVQPPDAPKTVPGAVESPYPPGTWGYERRLRRATGHAASDARSR